MNDLDLNNFELDIDVASKILDNVYATCEVEPNTIPLEVLQEFGECNTKNYRYAGVLSIVLLIMVLAFPVVFLKPSISVTNADTENYKQATYEFTVNKKILPITSVAVEMNGSKIPVRELGDNAYSVSTVENGTLIISATSSNHQTVSITNEVTNIDYDNPIVASFDWDVHHIYIGVADGEGSGIDFENIYGQELDGTKVTPASWDENTGIITFNAPNGTLNIFVPDKAGNTLHTLLTFE